MSKSTFHNQASSVFANTGGDIEHAGVVAALLNRMSNLWRRTKLTRLEALDDHMLSDIGITRMDLQWAHDLPLDRNPLIALDDLARARSRVWRMAAARALPGAGRR
ncbi:hypothetical protein MNBD_ALPHA09-1817 [hydrothermal vent metagenome]|uniref:DUF1127 domain-containing protein n=1 Tax=hydrothermal vent metagenome TaxID=652676 RepID=A0A3B0TJ37_9ZZZZ